MKASTPIQSQSIVSSPEFRGIDSSLVTEAEKILDESNRINELTTEELYSLNQRKEALKQAIQEAQQ